MNRLFIGLTISTAIAAAAFAGPAIPNGTVLQHQTSHTGIFGEVVSGAHTYGGNNTYFDSFGFPYSLSSPAGAVGFDNSVLIDFTTFAYGDFAGETGSIDISSIPGGFAPVAGSVQLLSTGGAPIAGATTSSTATSVSANWNVNSVLAVGSQAVLAWNTVPEPTTLSLLALGALGLIRRR